MSVINKMLRDLDQRQSARSVHPALAVDAAMPPHTGVWRDTAPVALPTTIRQRYPGNHPGRRSWVLVAGVIVGMALAAGLFWRPPMAASVASADAASAESTALGASAPSEVGDKPAGDAMNPKTVSPATLRMESVLAASTWLESPVSVRPATVGVAPVRASPQAVASSAVALPVAPHPEAVAPAAALVGQVVAPVLLAPTAQRQQQAGADALAQAQSLWNAASHDAAIDLMQQSVAAAERSAKAGSSPVGNPLLQSLVRELMRMQLAEGRFGGVWEVLNRLEPVLSTPADLWAIRANAAQRLGRHQDSVHAYTMALQSRPDEPRWQLGAAVSLAALGQTARAAEMADKARAVGEVSRDVLAYLRQMGVPLKEE